MTVESCLAQYRSIYRELEAIQQNDPQSTLEKLLVSIHEVIERVEKSHKEAERSLEEGVFELELILMKVKGGRLQ